MRALATASGSAPAAAGNFRNFRDMHFPPYQPILGSNAALAETRSSRACASCPTIFRTASKFTLTAPPVEYSKECSRTEGRTLEGLSDRVRPKRSISRPACFNSFSKISISRARAFSDHSGSYPELAKKLAHSVGVKSSMISAMASHRSSTVRAAAFLSRALSLAKACSMGLKSGE